MNLVVRNKHSLVSYTVLNYIDKGLSFLIPFLILKFKFTCNSYSEVEYIISFSLIVSNFLDFGIKTYFFIGYKKSLDSAIYVKRNTDLLNLLIVMYLTVVLILLPICFINDMFFYILIRSILLMYINVKSSICRLEDRPSDALMISFFINISSVFLIVVFEILKIEYSVFYFTLPNLLYLIFVSVPNFNVINRQKVICLFKFIVNSLLYTWPLLVNLLIAGLQNNFAKIYGYNVLDQNEFQNLAVLLRYFTIPLLAHTSALNYYTKSIYVSLNKFDKKIYFRYLTIILFGYVAMFLFIIISNYTHWLPYVHFDKIIVILFFSSVLLLHRTFLEQYFGKYEKLIYVAFSSIFSFLVFVGLLFYFKESIAIEKVIFSLFMSELINVMFIVAGFFKIILKN